MGALEVYLEEPSRPDESRLRVYDAPARAWVLSGASDDQVLELLASHEAARAMSAGRKAIARARAARLAAPPSYPPAASS